MTIADQTKKIRENKGLSQGQLAREASISNDYIHKIEAGKVTNIGIEVIEAIAKALNVHPSVLLFGKILEPKIEIEKKGKTMMELSEDEIEIIEDYRSSSRGRKEIIRDMIKPIKRRK